MPHQPEKFVPAAPMGEVNASESCRGAPIPPQDPSDFPDMTPIQGIHPIGAMIFCLVMFWAGIAIGALVAS